MAAQAEAKDKAFLNELPRRRAERKPAAKLSPAPVLSIAFTLNAGMERLIL